MAGFPFFFLLASLCTTSTAAPASSPDQQNLVIDAYAPASTSCPSSALVRPADGVSSDEAKYYSSRKAKADISLAAWLKQKGNFETTSLPSVGFTSSGGGYRAMLESAGVFQAFDSRDSNFSTVQ